MVFFMDQSSAYGQMNFNLPHDVVELPTRGLFYKSKKKSVKVGYLTAADENIIANYLSGNKTKDGLALSLIRSKLYEPDLRPEELLTGDVQAILLFLRNTSFGPEYTFNVTDPADGRKFEGTVLLDEINLKKNEFQPNENGEFVTKLPRTGVEVRLKPLTLFEYQEIGDRVDTYPTGMVAPKVTWTLQKMITSIDGDTDKSKIVQFIEQMPIMDSKHIRKFMDENEPSLDLRKEVIAPSGEKVTINVAFGVEFFRPFI
jgi:hypothetical protein